MAIPRVLPCLLGLVLACGDDGQGAGGSTTDDGTGSATPSTSTGSTASVETDDTDDTDATTSGADTSTGSGQDGSNSSGETTGVPEAEVCWRGGVTDDGMVAGPADAILGASFTDVSISLWVERSDAAVETQGLVSLGDGSFGSTAFVFWSAEGGTYSLAFYAADASVATPIANPQDWYHVVAVYGGDALSLYVDGELAATAPATAGYAHAPTGDVHLARFGPTGLPLDGWLDEVAIWSTALSAAEVAAIHDGGLALDPTVDAGDYVSSSSLAAFWRMGDSIDGPTGETMVPDEIGDADATLLGRSLLEVCPWP